MLLALPWSSPSRALRPPVLVLIQPDACPGRPCGAQVITAVIFTPVPFEALAHAVTGSTLTGLALLQVKD